MSDALKQAAAICAGREDITADLLQKEIEAIQPPAQAEPCDMGPICIGCEPRGPRGECPGAQAEARGDEPASLQAGLDAMDTIFRACHPLDWELRMRAASGTEVCLLAFRDRLKRDGWQWNPMRADTVFQSEATRLAPAAPQAGEAEPLFLLHTGQIDGGGEQDEWDTEANSWNAVEEFCRKHPGQTVGLYPASQPMSREGMSPLTDEQKHRLWVNGCEIGVMYKDAAMHLIGEVERAHGIGSGSGTGASHD